MTYSEFCDKLLPLYKNLSITPPMSPTEQKFCEFRITVNHPEIISRDNDDENKLWPWFGSAERGGVEYRPVTKFGHSVLATYEKMHNKTCLQKYLCCNCYKYEEKSLFRDIYKNIENSEKNVRSAVHDS